jgi:transposase
MLRPQPLGPVPTETARVAHAAFPKGHPYLRLADELGELFVDKLFVDCFPTHGQPALAPWRLTLVSVLQYAEGLSDRQAADAVRSRIDWKYVLRLELTDAGFDASVLSEFRARLLDGGAERLLLETLLTWCRERHLLRTRGRQRTDSTHVLAAVRALNRLELVTETMRHALDSLAVSAPEWLRTQAQLAWVERYTHRAEDDRLPVGKEARATQAAAIGADGHLLLSAVASPRAPAWFRQLPAVEALRRIWVQQFYREGDALHWRAEEQGLPPAALFISSPYDPDAHYAKKRSTQWVGYKVHLTETCEDDLPLLVTHVETTTAPIADGAATPRVHEALEARGLLPREHIVDTGYLDAALLVSSREGYGVELIGPPRADYHWQARDGTGFAAEHFHIDWERQQATCPAGCTSISWTPAVDRRTNQVIKIKFSSRDCGPCPSRASCTRSTKRYPRRTITVRAREAYEALQVARQREQTEEYLAVYAKRAGVEGTISRAVRCCSLRRSRYVGLARTHLGHVLTAVGLNFRRLGEWLTDTPRARTRCSPFAALMAEVGAA